MSLEYRFRQLNESVQLHTGIDVHLEWNTCSTSIGMGVQHGPEYAREIMSHLNTTRFVTVLVFGFLLAITWKLDVWEITLGFIVRA